MIVMVTAIELAPWRKDALEDLKQLIQTETRHWHAGLHRLALVRDSVHPTHHLILTEWEGHEHLAQAMRSGLVWFHRGWTAEWIADSPRVYDEVLEIDETAEGRT